MTDEPSSRPLMPTLPALAHQRASRRERVKARLTGASMQAASHAAQLAQQARHTLAPHVEAAVDWLTAPEQAAHLQRAAAQLAGLGMSIGFKADPRARLLFDLADWLEQRHGRLPVLQCLLAHNPMIDGSLLDLIRLRFDPRSALDRAPYDLAISRVQAHLLAMLGELAAVECEEVAPQDQAAIIAFFQAAGLPEQFHLLPLLASGDPEALAAHSPAPTAPRQRLRDTLRGRQTAQPQPTPAPTSDALTTLTPLGADPHFIFLFQSYTFFLQSYLARGFIEELPGLLSWAREIDAIHRAAQTPHDPDIIDQR